MPRNFSNKSSHQNKSDFDFDDLMDRPKTKKADRENDMMAAMLQNKLRFEKEKEQRKQERMKQQQEDGQSQSRAGKGSGQGQSQTSQVQPHQFSDSDSDESLIDWDDVDKTGAAGNIKRWANYHSINKNFYTVNANVEKMTDQDVKKWRKDNHDIKVVHLRKSDDVPEVEIPKPRIEFEYNFEKYPEILDTIKAQGFSQPSPIQAQFWPCVMQGHDVIGIAQTGTGKTLAFLLPMFLHIKAQDIDHSKRKGPIALILSPTRELALQIEMEINKYTYKGIKCICIYGGGDVKKQQRAIEAGCEIVVATPGRFNDLCTKEIIKLDYISYVVLDEADRMLDMGFEPQILKIFLDIRPDRTTLMTSATWPEGVRRLCNTYLKNPIQIVVGSLDLTAVYTVTQYIKIISDESRKEESLHYYINKMLPSDKYIIFCGRKATVDQLSSNLCLKGMSCDAIHGGREQEDREIALKDFRSGKIKILFATDVASRGIDVNDITVVINFDFPRNMEEYVHRVGRTGRSGRKGKAVTLITRRDWDYAEGLIVILERSNQKVPDGLRDMAERYSAWKAKKVAEGDTGRFGRSSRIKYRQ